MEMAKQRGDDSKYTVDTEVAEQLGVSQGRSHATIQERI